MLFPTNEVKLEAGLSTIYIVIHLIVIPEFASLFTAQNTSQNMLRLFPNLAWLCNCDLQDFDFRHGVAYLLHHSIFTMNIEGTQILSFVTVSWDPTCAQILYRERQQRTEDEVSYTWLNSVAWWVPTSSAITFSLPRTHSAGHRSYDLIWLLWTVVTWSKTSKKPFGPEPLFELPEYASLWTLWTQRESFREKTKRSFTRRHASGIFQRCFLPTPTPPKQWNHTHNPGWI